LPAKRTQALTKLKGQIGVSVALRILISLANNLRQGIQLAEDLGLFEQVSARLAQKRSQGER
jgi:hypothetical protein